MSLLTHWRNKFRSLYASESEFQTLPEQDRVRHWSGAAAYVDAEFSRRTKGKILLDLGCGPRGARRAVQDIPFSKYVGVDYAVDVQPDVVSGLDRLSLLDNSVDSINCISVLEHVYDIKAALTEMYRVLTPGGCARVQTPFMLGYHDFPDDYFRYTHSALRRMFEEAGFHIVSLETEWSKGPYLNAAQVLWHGSWGYYQPRWRLLTRILSLFLLKLGSWIDRRYVKDHVGIYHAVILLAEKPGGRGNDQSV